MKDFVAKVGRTYSNDDSSDIPGKCQVLEEKLASLLDTLTLESKMAEIEQAVSRFLNLRLVVSDMAKPLAYCTQVAILCDGFDLLQEPIACDVHLGLLLTQRAHAHFAVFLNLLNF